MILPRRWLLYAGIGSAWLALGLWFTTRSQFEARAFIDVGYVVLPLAGLAASVTRALLHRGSRRAAWVLMALAFLAWSAGGLLWAYDELVLRQPPPFPGPSDVGFVAYPLLAAAGMYLLSSQWAPRARVHEVLDVLFIAVVVVYALYDLVLLEALRSLPDDPLTTFVALAYPAADVAALTLTIFTLSRAHRRLQPALIGGGLAVLAVVDSAWIYLTATGRYESGTPFDLLWHLSFILVILGIVLTRRAQDDVAWPTLPLARHALPLALSLVAAAFILPDLWRSGLDRFEAGLVGLLLVIGGARQTVALVNNDRLRASIATTASQLEAANAKLEEQARLRTQFINATAHELNNPLTPLRLQARLLANPAHGGDAGKRAASVAVVGRAIERLGRLVEDLLSLARIESRTLRVSPRPVDAVAVVRETLQFYHEQAAERDVRLELVAAERIPWTVDPERLAQIVANFVTNAVKYSPAGLTVRIEVHADGDGLRIEVTDQGPGLTPEQQLRLFQPFSQVHGDGTQQKGTGLGLHICRLLAQLMGGDVGCRSGGAGKGTTFWVRLPQGQDDR